jgi:hypothetical protein
MCVTVTNCGTVASSYTATISGADKADYSVVSQNPSPVIAPQGTYDFCVQFNDTNVGPTNASLDIATPNVITQNIPLTGAGACAILAPSVPTIPNTGDNEKTLFTFTITNSGSSAWTPGIALVSGTGMNAFNQDPITVNPTTIAPGNQGVVTMTFHPPLGSQGQSFAANVSWPNAGPCGNAFSVDLNGQSITSSVKETASIDGFVLDQTYPNPTQGKANFTYTTPSETEVQITLVDMTGRLIRTLISGRVSQGEHLVNFDASNLPSGTYMYILESGGTRLVRQLILTK